MLDILFRIAKWLFGKETTGSIIIKAILVFFLGATVYGMASIAWETATEDVMWDNDESRHLNRCETYLREKEYGELWDYLDLYDLTDEKYQVYWAAVEYRVEQIEQKQLEEMEWH